MHAQCKKIAFYKNLDYNNNKTLATDVCEEDSGSEEKKVAQQPLCMRYRPLLIFQLFYLSE